MQYKNNHHTAPCVRSHVFEIELALVAGKEIVPKTEKVAWKTGHMALTLNAVLNIGLYSGD